MKVQKLAPQNCASMMQQFSITANQKTELLTDVTMTTIYTMQDSVNTMHSKQPSNKSNNQNFIVT